MQHFNTIIIGGGLSGCVLGYLLKNKNESVLIIEKQSIKTKNKLCGGLLTDKSYKLLIDIYGKEEIKKLSITKYNKGSITNNNHIFDIENINTYSIYRKELDDFVLNKYISQRGKIIDNVIYEKVDLINNSLTIKNETYTYDNIVGADGVFSQLRKEITDKNQKSNFAFEIIDYSKKYDIINVSFLNDFKGYGWVIPNNKNTLIGIGNVVGVSKIEKDFSNYLKTINIDKTNKKGAFLPSGNDILLTYNENMFFIGDSAGLISPITGEGIYYALYSARVLSDTMNSNYTKEMKTMIKDIKRDLFYLKFVYNAKIRNYLFSRYNKNQLITKIINRFAKHIL